MSQIRQAERVRRRNPLLPVFGILIAITLMIFSYAVEEPFIKLIQTKFPQAGIAQSADPFSTTRMLFTFGIWLVLIVIFSLVVAILGGRSPDSAQNLIMPPRTEAERDRRYGGGDSN